MEALGRYWLVLAAQGPDPKAILALPGGQGRRGASSSASAASAAAASATIALDGASIAVDVANVPAPDPHKIDSMYQYIGEVDGWGPDGTPCLRARVARCVDGLDLKLYGRALHERNKFLNIKG